MQAALHASAPEHGEPIEKKRSGVHEGGSQVFAAAPGGGGGSEEENLEEEEITAGTRCDCIASCDDEACNTLGGS